jgi:PncC family amidohydrolase
MSSASGPASGASASPSLETLARAAGDALVARGWTVGAAESCTAGLLLESLTAIPGSSRYVRGGVVAYADEVKRDLLGVSPAHLERHGAVSEVVAKEMAEAVARAVGADVGIAITGIAGPGGGTPEKPVGTVWFALAVPGAPTWTGSSRFEGGRAEVREAAAARALELLARPVP